MHKKKTELREPPDPISQKRLAWTVANGHNDIASRLILNSITPENQDAILSFVNTAALALELITLEPAITHVLLKNKRIAALIHNDNNCHIMEKTIKWYKPHGRRPSWFADINIETGSSCVYQPEKKLGAGNFGVVRSFLDAKNHQRIAVKSLKKDKINLSQPNRQHEENLLEYEAAFNRQAYPNDTLYEVFQFDREINGMKTYSNRAVTRYIEGEIAQTFFKKITCERDLAKLILRITQELQRIHEPKVGIIHGDIKDDNIMIHQVNNEFMIRFIDFGNSSYFMENSPITYEETKIQHLPPELFDDRRHTIRPHPSIDVYSFGSMLNRIFSNHLSYLKLIKSFPFIHTFILESQNNDPCKRPSLAAFYQQLNDELNRQTSFKQLRKRLILVAQQYPSLSKKQQDLCLTFMLTHDIELITREFESGEILNNFLSYALAYNKTEVVTRLMAHEQWPEWSQRKDSNGYTLLHLMAWTGSVKACEHLRPLIDINDVNNPEKNTPLHLAASKGHTDTCTWLLKHGADLTLQNKAGQTPDKLWHIHLKLKKASSDLMSQKKHLEQKKRQILELLKTKSPTSHTVSLSTFLNFFKNNDPLTDLYQRIKHAAFSVTDIQDRTANDVLNDIIDTWQLSNQSSTRMEETWREIKRIINPELRLPQTKIAQEPAQYAPIGN